MHLGQLLARVRRVLNDEAGERWNTEELVEYLDEAHRDFCARLGLNRGSSALSPMDRLTEAGDATSYAFFQLPAEATELTLLKLNGEVLTATDLSCLPEDFESEYGAPDEYLMGPYGYNVLRVYPMPADPVNLLAYYVRTPASLATTQAPEIPAPYHVALANYAIARCYLDDSESNEAHTKGALFQQLYEEKLAEATAAAARQFDRTPTVIPTRWL